MVLDLGRDYYKLDGPQLESLSAKVRSGDMEEVLRVYEREMQVSLCVIAMTRRSQEHRVH